MRSRRTHAGQKRGQQLFIVRDDLFSPRLVAEKCIDISSFNIEQFLGAHAQPRCALSHRESTAFTFAPKPLPSLPPLA